MVDDHARQAFEQLAMALAHRADPLEGRAVGDDQQVVGSGRIGVGPEPLDAVEEVVQRRHRVGADRVGRAAQRVDDVDDAKRRPERVGIGVLVAHREDAPRAAIRSTTTSGTASRYGVRSTVIGASTGVAGVGGGRPPTAARLGRDHGRRRLLGGIALVVHARDRRGQRLTEREARIRLRPA